MDDGQERICPLCGSSNALTIQYGFPTEKAMEAVARGEIALGGCLIGADSPQWQCGSCDKRF